MASQLPSPAPEAARLSPWSVRASLIWLVLACLLPGILGAVALFLYEFQAGRAQLERDNLLTTRALSQAVDNRILQVQALATGLAASDDVRKGELEQFRERARETLERSGLGLNVVLADENGQQILNTATESAPLPAHGNPDLVRRVFQTGRPAISNLFESQVMARPVMAVGVPVLLRGRLAYALSISVPPEEFAGILKAQGFPSGWVATIFDGDGMIVARSREMERFIAQKPAEDYFRDLMEFPEGTFEAVMKDGVAVYAAHTRSPATGWHVAIGVPQDTLTGNLTRRLAVITTGIALLFAAGVALAWLMGERIARSFHALKGPAFSLGAGRAVAIPRTEVREAAEVAAALEKASRLLKARDEALQATQDHLRMSEAKYRSLFANMTEAFALGEPILDEANQPLDVRFLEVNDAFYHQSGLPRGIEGRPLREYLPRLKRSWIERYAAVASTGEAARFEDHNGDTGRHYDVYAFSPNPGRFAILFRDVTEQKRNQMALQLSERRYRALFNNRTSAIAHHRVVVDDRGQPVDYYVDELNDAYSEILGLRRDEVEGRLASEIFPDLTASASDLIKDLGWIGLQGGEGSFEAYLPSRHQWLAIYAYSAIPGEFTSIFTDITGRKKAEAEIQRLNAELEERVKRRTTELERSNAALVKSNIELQRFAHAAAHDLQTPLRSIVGFTQLLWMELSECTDDRAREWMALVIDNTRRLQTLIQELLAYSRLDAEARPLEAVAVAEVLGEIKSTLEMSIREAGAEVTWGDMPTVMADRTQLAQLFQNLVENGLKYNHSNPPRVSIGCEARESEWLFSVADNGIGIDPRHQAKIFEIFRRLHAQHEIPGTGIGLAICQRIVERHGGRLWVESQPGEGSVFYFTLPVLPAPSD